MNKRMPLGTPGIEGYSVGGKAHVFDSWHMRHLTQGATIDRNLIAPNVDGERIILAGEVIGKVTATGLYGLWEMGATDGRQIARGCVVQDTNCTNSNAFVGAVDECRIHVARMPRRFTQIEWDAIHASPYVKITPVEPFEVPGPVAIGVVLAPATLTVAVGVDVLIAAVFNPTNTMNQNGLWESSAPAVAIVNQRGEVRGVAVGTAVITFTPQVGNLAPVTANVTVS